MRLSLFIPVAACSLMACATPEPVAPEEAVEVNPAIAARIEQRVLEGREGPAPDVRDIPSKGPAVPTAAEMAAQRAAILEERAALAANVSSDRTAEEEEALARRAEALLAQIERDRALAEAEGLLSKGNVPSRPTPPEDQ
ncbi:MAG: hypothetical protein AAGA69_05325 [Pseudomonadota bacterium]